jgi:hypothetical protein
MSRPAEESPSPETAPAARFYVTGDAAPGFVPRVIELFAKRNIVPDEIHARAVDGRQSIEIRAPGMEPPLAAYFGRCLREIVTVERVLVSQDLETDGDMEGDMSRGGDASGDAA